MESKKRVARKATKRQMREPSGNPADGLGNFKVHRLYEKFGCMARAASAKVHRRLTDEIWIPVKASRASGFREEAR